MKREEESDAASRGSALPTAAILDDHLLAEGGLEDLVLAELQIVEVLVGDGNAIDSSVSWPVLVHQTVGFDGDGVIGAVEVSAQRKTAPARTLENFMTGRVPYVPVVPVEVEVKFVGNLLTRRASAGCRTSLAVM